MEFFVPETSSPEEAEEVWQATRSFALAQMGEREITDRRIFRIEWTHNGQDLTAEVGKMEPLEGEPVFVILDSNPYLICTPNRGVVRGLPIFAGVRATHHVTYFDGS